MARSPHAQLAAFAISFLLLGCVVGLAIPYSEIRAWVWGSDHAQEEDDHHDHADDDHDHADDHHDHADDHDHDHADDHAGEEEQASSDLMELTLTAQKAIGLEIGSPKLSDYSKLASLPALVRERPAVSNLQASSKLQGIVTKVYVSIGESVKEGDPLVDLELTGESLAESQSVLLDSSKNLEIVRSEIDRLSPLAQSGGVARKNLLAQQYEEKRLSALVETKKQELLVRGFTAEQIQTIVEGGRLIRTLTVRVPVGIQPAGPDTARVAGSSRNRMGRFVGSAKMDPWVYSVEHLNVSPGHMVMPGQNICDLSYHQILLLKGQAYESDVPQLNEALQSGAGLSIQMGSDEAPEFIDDIPILYLDNHIDAESQTISVYLELTNSVLAERTEPIFIDGESTPRNSRLFRSWKYRPDQRGHILLPQKTWQSKFVIPAEAVAQDGLEPVVFKWVETHHTTDEPPHSVFQKTPVHILHKNRHDAVIETGDALQADDQIATNNAHLLLMEMSRGEGGHDQHHHDH